MAHTIHTITSQALALDPAERLQLANRLIDRVVGPEDTEWASAWSSELDRRSAEVERGEVLCRSGEDVRADLHGPDPPRCARAAGPAHMAGAS